MARVWGSGGWGWDSYGLGLRWQSLGWLRFGVGMSGLELRWLELGVWMAEVGFYGGWGWNG